MKLYLTTVIWTQALLTASAFHLGSQTYESRLYNALMDNRPVEPEYAPMLDDEAYYEDDFLKTNNDNEEEEEEDDDDYDDNDDTTILTTKELYDEMSSSYSVSTTTDEEELEDDKKYGNAVNYSAAFLEFPYHTPTRYKDVYNTYDENKEGVEEKNEPYESNHEEENKQSGEYEDQNQGKADLKVSLDNDNNEEYEDSDEDDEEDEDLRILREEDNDKSNINGTSAEKETDWNFSELGSGFVEYTEDNSTTDIPDEFTADVEIYSEYSNINNSTIDELSVNVTNEYIDHTDFNTSKKQDYSDYSNTFLGEEDILNSTELYYDPNDYNYNSSNDFINSNESDIERQLGSNSNNFSEFILKSNHTDKPTKQQNVTIKKCEENTISTNEEEHGDYGQKAKAISLLYFKKLFNTKMNNQEPFLKGTNLTSVKTYSMEDNGIEADMHNEAD